MLKKTSSPKLYSFCFEVYFLKKGSDNCIKGFSEKINHSNPKKLDIAKDIMNKCSTIKFLIKFDDINGKLDMFFNDEKIEENLSFDTLSCDTPHIKFGLYRPGY